MGKKKENKNNYWKNFPEELKLMCLAEVRGTGHYCTAPVLKCLIDHMHDCDTYIMETTPYDVIHWIDTAAEMCLFPLEQHEDDWIANAEDIRKVLTRSEELLIKVAPADYREGYRTPYSSRHGTGIIGYLQKLDVYFSILYMFTGEWEKLEDRFKRLLSDTEKNVRHMLSYEKAEEFASEDDWAEYHYPGTDAWEPINWICREFIPGGKARKLFAKVYEEYVVFLYTLREERHRTRACAHLHVNAEKRLRNICELILDELVESLEDMEGDNQSILADRELYEEMIQNSEERSSADNKENASSSEETMDGIPELYYHRQWCGFTQKLRKLLEEYPTLPVVVPYQLKINSGDLDCSVASVHDYKTGEFREKVIAIHENRDSLPEDIGDNFFDLPF